MTVLVATIAFGLACAAGDPVSPAAPQLTWQATGIESSAPAGDGATRAELTLTTTRDAALPSAGWALYFNCLSGVLAGSAGPGLRLEDLGGTWYRVVPESGFSGVSGGAALTMQLHHAEVVPNVASAPIGPYLVFADTPPRVVEITDYHVTPPHYEPVSGRQGMPPAAPTPADLYARNSVTVDIPASALPPVFPSPRTTRRSGLRTHWSRLPRIVADRGTGDAASLAREWLRPYFDAASTATAPVLRLRVGRVAHSQDPEAYSLKVSPSGTAVVTGNSPAGLVRGLVSLRDLMPLVPAPATGADLEALSINDAPRFGYRGLMIDVARNFVPTHELLRVIDLMTRYKLNRLHLHLSDDEGWRIEIAGLPELTAIGAQRGQQTGTNGGLPPAYGSGAASGRPPGSGYYSAVDYSEILRYAARRQITVIPELDMPGHARAAVRAMALRAQALAANDPAAANRYRLADPADESRYESAQRYRDNVMNAGLESTYAFIDTVVAALATMHRNAGVPLTMLHVGGDELPAGAWEHSPAARSYQRAHGLGSARDLAEHFFDRVGAMLARRGIALAGWEEIATRPAATGDGSVIVRDSMRAGDVTAYAWNDTGKQADLAYRLANAGIRTVLTPATSVYLDLAHTPDPVEPGATWAGYVDLRRAWSYEPLAQHGSVTTGTRLSAAGLRHIAGIEATLFSETVQNAQRRFYMLMPRLAAIAERAWAPAAGAGHPHADWSTFANVLGKRVLPRLDAEDPAVNYRLAPPGLSCGGDYATAAAELPGTVLRYTTDGSEPTSASPRFEGRVPFDAQIRAAAFTTTGRHGRISSLRRASAPHPTSTEAETDDLTEYTTCQAPGK